MLQHMKKNTKVGVHFMDQIEEDLIGLKKLMDLILIVEDKKDQRMKHILVMRLRKRR